MLRFFLIGGVAATTLLAACQRGGAAEAAARSARVTRGAVSSEAPAAPAPVPAAGLIAGTPAGGLARWIAEVRRGLADVPRLAAADPAAAQKSALELYLTRQEYIEMYWGSAGKLTRGAALPVAVKEAETRFHAILEQLQPGKPVDGSLLKRSIGALDEQYGLVLSAASAAGVREDPHAAGPGAGETQGGGRP